MTATADINTRIDKIREISASVAAAVEEQNAPIAHDGLLADAAGVLRVASLTGWSPDFDA